MNYPFTLPALAYGHDALEPHIDSRTMEVHHGKHHQGYVDKLNAAVEKYPNLHEMSLEDMLKGIASLEVDDADRIAIQNNGGGHANHSLFWEIMGPEKQIDDILSKEVAETFESIKNFQEVFADSAAKQFGSGWAWLVRDEEGKLDVYSTANQDSPYMQGHTPIIGLDVWEHAYYLKYQNKRPDYIESWWNVLKVL